MSNTPVPINTTNPHLGHGVPQNAQPSSYIPSVPQPHQHLVTPTTGVQPPIPPVMPTNGPVPASPFVPAHPHMATTASSVSEASYMPAVNETPIANAEQPRPEVTHGADVAAAEIMKPEVSTSQYQPQPQNDQLQPLDVSKFQATTSALPKNIVDERELHIPTQVLDTTHELTLEADKTEQEFIEEVDKKHAQRPI